MYASQVTQKQPAESRPARAPTRAEQLEAEALAARAVRVLFGSTAGPARSGDDLTVKKLTNALLVRAYKAIMAVKASHTAQLAAAKVNREMALGFLLSDLTFERSAELPERGEAEKAGKRVGTHLGGERGVVKRLERLTSASAEQARTAKAKTGVPADELAETLAGIDKAVECDRKGLEGEPYVLFKERAAALSDDEAGSETTCLRSQEAARSAQREEAGVAHATLEVAIERVFAYLRSDIEVVVREQRLGTTVAAQRDPSMQPIWREVCEERLLAYHLIERQMVEQLRDRDEDVDYWHQQCQEKGAALRMAAQNLRRLEAQVVFLGGSLPDTAFTASEDAEHHGEPVPPDARGVNAVIRELLGRSMSELR